MAWYSILPAELVNIETWIIRIFFVLGILTIVPWAALVVFDIVFYIWRMITYEFPVVGGRARGMQRPRAPSLNERPSGQRRAFGLRGVEVEDDEDDLDGGYNYTRKRGEGEMGKENVDEGEVKWRNPKERLVD